MKILIICSKFFYEKIPPIQDKLKCLGHEIVLPNSYDEPFKEMELQKGDVQEYKLWKKEMFARSIRIIKEIDAVLVLNFEKKGIQNYIGGATFLEIYDAYRESKKIFLYNPIPEGMLYDEIHGFDPILIEGNLDLVK